jgi:hypothetical protein
VGDGLAPADGLAPGDGVGVGAGKMFRARIRTTSSPTNGSRLNRTATVTFSLGK